MLLNLISANSFIKNNNGDGFWVKISITPKCELFLVKKNVQLSWVSIPTDTFL